MSFREIFFKIMIFKRNARLEKIFMINVESCFLHSHRLHLAIDLTNFLFSRANKISISLSTRRACLQASAPTKMPYGI